MCSIRGIVRKCTDRRVNLIHAMTIFPPRVTLPSLYRSSRQQHHFSVIIMWKCRQLTIRLKNLPLGLYTEQTLLDCARVMSIPFVSAPSNQPNRRCRSGPKTRTFRIIQPTLLLSFLRPLISSICLVGIHISLLALQKRKEKKDFAAAEPPIHPDRAGALPGKPIPLPPGKKKGVSCPNTSCSGTRERKKVYKMRLWGGRSP